VTRKEGTRELTLDVPSGNIGSTPSIESLALSSDGSTIAFTSARDDFVLSEPHPVGSFRAFPKASDIYVVRLVENTLERAVVNYEAGDPNESVIVNPTLTAGGQTVAFVSYATNLIYGDANEQPDAFVAALQAPAGTSAPPVEVNTAQAGFSLSSTASPELGLRVKRGKNGELLLLVETPGAGSLLARARGSVPVKIGRRTRRRSVLLAHASGIARSEGTTTLVMRLGSRYAKDIERKGRLHASVTVRYTPRPPEEALSTETNASFLSTNARKAASSPGN
jgi:hypothetical protein